MQYRYGNLPINHIPINLPIDLPINHIPITPIVITA